MDGASERSRERSERRPAGGERPPAGDRGAAPRSRFRRDDRDGDGPGGRPRGGGRFGGRRRREPVFLDNEEVDDKDLARRRRCIEERGKIVGRRKTGNSAKIQRTVTTAIKRARHLALLPFEIRDVRR